MKPPRSFLLHSSFVVHLFIAMVPLGGTVARAASDESKPAASTMTLEQLLAEFHDPGERISMPPSQRRIDILNALRHQGEPLLTRLKRDLGNDSPAIRVAAAQVLTNLGPAARPAVPELVKAMADQDDNVRRWAVIAVGPLQDPRAFPALVQASRDPSPRVRSALLVQGRPAMADAVFATAALAVTDKDIFVRAAAITQLKLLKDKRAVPLVAACLEDVEIQSHDVRDGIRTANRNCDEAVKALEYLVNDTFQLDSKDNQEGNDRKGEHWRNWWKTNQESILKELDTVPDLVRPSR